MTFHLLGSMLVYLLFRGSQLSTRQAYNYIDALIKDPERDVTEILPVRSRKFDSSSTATHKHSSLANSPTLPSSSSKTATTQYSTLKSSPPNQQSFQQLHSKHSAPVCVSPATRSTSKSLLTQNASPQNRLPPRMGGASTVATAAATTIVKIESAGWASRTPTTNQNNVSLKRVSSHQVIPVTVIKPTVTKQSVISTSKPLPKPIGSNRPVKTHINKESTQTTQSTKTSPSVSTQHVSGAHINTTHSLSQNSSTLSSFFSQVATQARSPMIWNGPEISSDGNGIIVTSSTSHTAVTTSSQCFVPTSVMAHSASPTPSVSPTPSNSTSPSPSCANEERPHLNPIGTERAHKRSSTNSVPNIPRMPAFQPSEYGMCYEKVIFVAFWLLSLLVIFKFGRPCSGYRDHAIKNGRLCCFTYELHIRIGHRICSFANKSFKLRVLRLILNLLYSFQDDTVFTSYGLHYSL